MFSNILTGLVYFGIIALVLFIVTALAMWLGGWFFFIIGGFLLLAAANFLGDIINNG